MGSIDMQSLIVGVFFGAFFGIFTGWALISFRLGKEQAAEKNLSLEKNLGDEKERLRKKESLVLELSRRLSTRNAEYAHLQEKYREGEKDREALIGKCQAEFRNLANDILEEKTLKFTEQNRVNLEAVLRPLNEKIQDFEKQVADTYDKEAKERFSLQKEIRNL